MKFTVVEQVETTFQIMAISTGSMTMFSIEMKRKIISVIALAFSITLIVLGIHREEAECVIEKATKICMECIGIG